MKHTIHIALGETDRGQVAIAAALTITGAKAKAAQSIHTVAQMVKVVVETEAKPRTVYAVMAIDDGWVELDRIELSEHPAQAGEAVKALAL